MLKLLLKLASLTTGNRASVEGPRLCRESKVGPSTKQPLPRADCRQRWTVGETLFAKGRAIGKDRPSAKYNLYRGPALGKIGPSAKYEGRQTVRHLPSVFAESHQLALGKV
jgi:hypothetical protein